LTNKNSFIRLIKTDVTGGKKIPRSLPGALLHDDKIELIRDSNFKFELIGRESSKKSPWQPKSLRGTL
tara:strand:+ start:319 stop:522 length:204 start_codon:yes stop_codon:yes gene_type:complete